MRLPQTKDPAATGVCEAVQMGSLALFACKQVVCVVFPLYRPARKQAAARTQAQRQQYFPLVSPPRRRVQIFAGSCLQRNGHGRKGYKTLRNARRKALIQGWKEGGGETGGLERRRDGASQPL